MLCGLLAGPGRHAAGRATTEPSRPTAPASHACCSHHQSRMNTATGQHGLRSPKRREKRRSLVSLSGSSQQEQGRDGTDSPPLR